MFAAIQACSHAECPSRKRQREAEPTEEDDWKRTLKERRADRPNGDVCDEVIIRMVPRYKMSHASGNVWRVSALVQFKQKRGGDLRKALRDNEERCA